MTTMPTDLEIARSASLRPIGEVTADMGVPAEYVEHRGREVAKVSLNALDEMGPPRANYHLISATNPTPRYRASGSVTANRSGASSRNGRTPLRPEPVRATSP